MQKITKSLTYWLSVVAIGLVVGLSIQFVTAWTEPSATPPGGNIGAPINTGSIGQSKEGGMLVRSIPATVDSPNGLLVQYGKVGIGNTNPGASHTVAGQPLVALDVRDAATSQDKIITGVANPQDANDAANKAYVDAKGGGSGYRMLIQKSNEEFTSTDRDTIMNFLASGKGLINSIYCYAGIDDYDMVYISYPSVSKESTPNIRFSSNTTPDLSCSSSSGYCATSGDVERCVGGWYIIVDGAL